MLRLTYLLEETAVSGLVRAVLAQSDALVSRAHQVRIVTTEGPVSWRSSRAEWGYVDDFRAVHVAGDEVMIATSWSSAAAAYDLAGARAVHFIRRYEGALPELQPLRAEIDAAYSLPVTKLVTSQALVEVLQPFGAQVAVAAEIVDDDVFRLHGVRENEPLRVLLCGQSQSEVKGIDDGYGAAAHARWFHQRFDLIRVAPWAPSREEPLDAVQEFHVGLTAAEMTRLMHSCDVIIAPGHREEGSSLALCEALAAGLAAVMTATPAHRALGDDVALVAPEENAVELGERLIEVLSDRAVRERLRARGRAVAEQWRAATVAARLEEIFTATLSS